MRRCYRNVALVVGTIILASNTFSNSCSLTTMEVYAAEDTHLIEVAANEMFSSESEQIVKKLGTFSNETTAEVITDENAFISAVSDNQNSIQTGEENVETEIPADESESDPTEVEPEEYNHKIELNTNEYHVLLRIVQAEAGGEDITGKMLVANVIMNRVNHNRFPNTVTEVVYQTNANGKAQFSPTVDGRMDSVNVSQETVDAVERVLNGEDSSNGALYFRSVRSSSGWHDRALTRVLEHGNHIFYTI
mgnify:CR=1 FL=1